MAEVVAHTEPELITAGLYEPAAPNAADRLALLHWLLGRGFTVAQLIAANEAGNLTSIAGDTALVGDARLSLRDIAPIVGLDLDELVLLMRASGFAPRDLDTPWYAERDVQTFILFAAARQLFSQDELLHFTRVMGSAVTRVADAANSLFFDDVERPLANAGGGELALAQANLLAIELLAQVSEVMDTLLRFHVRESTERFRDATRSSPDACVRMAVGFVDLCGFTARSAELSDDELAKVIRDFEAEAYDVVSAHGGRVVKLIGDEVMFASVEPSTACEIAAALVEAFGRNDLSPRGGVAFGPVLARGGDYYGPIVNLASRIADQAVPGEILATPAVAAGAPDRLFAPAGRRQLKGFAEPVELVSLS